MDIILKFGNHYYETSDSSIWLQFALTVLGAFLGFGFALLIYYKSIRREKTEEESKQQQESHNKLKYHKLLIENLIMTTKNQIELIEKYNVEQEKDLLNIIQTKQVVTNDFKRLVYINKEIFESFNNLYKNNTDWIEDLKKLHITIDYIDGILSEIYRMNNNHLKDYYIKASEIKQNIELIPDRLSSFAFNIKNQLGEKRWGNDLYIFVDNAIKQYLVLVNVKADFNKINNDYLDPLLNSILENFPNEPFFEEIKFLAKKSRVRMNDIKTDVKNMIQEMSRVKNELEKSLNKVDESIRKLYNVS